eukprot:GABV01002401.1.p1 GENE.GABV01002401.1~~GABV01002401.1.p1  ORF type:complete len:223 (-),score=107.81 GABV01002401.1:2-670(-)
MRLKPSKLGSTAVGIQTAEGVVLAVEKRISSPLLVPSSVEKIVEIDSHIGCAMSGIVSDARSLVDHSRVEVQNHWFTFDEKMTTQSVAQSVCDLALGFGEGTQYERARPFGVALLLAGVDEKEGPSLWHTDPSGTYTRYRAKAIGAGSEGAQTALQDESNKSMTLREAQILALQVLKQVMEERITNTNVELAIVPTETRQYKMLLPEELDELLAELKDDVTA